MRIMSRYYYNPGLRPMKVTFYGYLILVFIIVLGMIFNIMSIVAYSIILGLIWVLLGPYIDSCVNN